MLEAKFSRWPVLIECKCVKTVIALLLTLSFCQVSPIAQTPVATIEGVEIQADDLAVSDEGLKLQYKSIHGHAPSSPEEVLKFEKFKDEARTEKFLEKVRRIIRGKRIGKFEISVSEAEITNEWRRLTANQDKQAAVKQQREMLTPLLKALKAVHVSGEDEQAVYSRELANRMTRTEWEVHLNYYDTPERREILERAIAQTATDLEKPDPGVRHRIVAEKLNRRVDEEIARGDAEFREYLRHKTADPANEKLKLLGGKARSVVETTVQVRAD